MDLISVEIGLGLLLLFVVPVIYAATRQSQKEKKTIRKIEAFCSKQNIHIKTHELINSLFLGIDEHAGYFVYSLLPVSEGSVEMIELGTVKSVQAVKKELPKPGQAKAKIIESVVLEVTFKDGRAKKEVVFFDDVMGIDPHISFNEAGKWSLNLNALLK